MSERTIAGRYDLLEPLAREGAWLAEDTELGRQVELRLLDREGEHFEAGARAAASLAHPHIGRLYDYGESDGDPFLVAEHLPGGSLETRIATGGPLTADAADRVARDVAAALAYAHGQGVVHGDLSAANVEFDGEGRAKVTGFGAPSAVPASSGADVAAFGALGFLMLTGREPDDPAALERLRPDAPPALAAAVLAALGGAEARPADGAALVAMLGDEAAPVPPPEEPQTEVLRPPAAAPARRRAPAALGVALGLLALLGAGIAAAFLAGGDGATPPPSLSLPRVSTASTAASDPPDETTAPPPSTSTEATTSSERTTTARTGRTTTQAPAATTAPPATTEPPPPPPPTEDTTPTDPTTTAATTTDPGTTTTTP